MSKGLRIALIASVAVVLLGLIGGGVFVYLKFDSVVETAVNDKVAKANTSAVTAKAEATTLYFYKPSHFVTELADPAPKVRYVDVTIALAYGAQADADKAKEEEPIVRNIVLQILRARLASDLSGAQGMANLEKDLTEALLKHDPKLVKVAVTDMVIQ